MSFSPVVLQCIDMNRALNFDLWIIILFNVAVLPWLLSVCCVSGSAGAAIILHEEVSSQQWYPGILNSSGECQETLCISPLWSVSDPHLITLTFSGHHILSRRTSGKFNYHLHFERDFLHMLTHLLRSGTMLTMKLAMYTRRCIRHPPLPMST